MVFFFFYFLTMWMPSCYSTFCWKDYLFSIILPLRFCQNWLFDWFYFWTLLFFIDLYLFFHHYHPVFLTISKWVLKAGNVIPQLCISLVLCWLPWVFCLSIWISESVCYYPQNSLLGFVWDWVQCTDQVGKKLVSWQYWGLYPWT